MSRRKAHIPSLADALAKDFAELKNDTEHSSPTVEKDGVPEAEKVVQKESESKPDYRGPTQHVAQQNSFVVNVKRADETSQEKLEQPTPKKAEILDRPTTSIGDDFDVEW